MGGQMAAAYIFFGVIVFVVCFVSIVAAIDLITRLGNAMGLG